MTKGRREPRTHATASAIGSSRRRAARGERGYLLVWFGAMLLTLLLFAAFAVDLGNWYLTRERVQRAADAAALAGVVHKSNGDPPQAATQAALDTAGNNGFDDNDSATTITFPPVGEAQLAVNIDHDVDNFFLKLISLNTTTISADATAEYNAPLPMGSPSGVLGREPESGAASWRPSWDVSSQFWLSVHGPRTTKFNGDAVEADECVQVPVAVGGRGSDAFPSGDNSIPDGCDSETLSNQDGNDDGHLFTVRVRDARPGESLEIQLFDPILYSMGSQCEQEGATGGIPELVSPESFAPIAPGREQVITTIKDWWQEAPADDRYSSGADNPFCTGDDRLNGAPPALCGYIPGGGAGGGTVFLRRTASWVAQQILGEQDPCETDFPYYTTTTVALYEPDDTPLNDHDNVDPTNLVDPTVCAQRGDPNRGNNPADFLGLEPDPGAWEGANRPPPHPGAFLDGSGPTSVDPKIGIQTFDWPPPRLPWGVGFNEPMYDYGWYPSYEFEPLQEVETSTLEWVFVPFLDFSVPRPVEGLGVLNPNSRAYYGGVDDLSDWALTEGSPGLLNLDNDYSREFRRTYRQWVTFCTVSLPGGEALPDGDYVLQIETDNATVVDPANGGGAGSNNLSIRAGLVNAAGVPVDIEEGRVSVFAKGAMSIFANLNDDTQFFLARILPASHDRTLELGFFDPGDAQFPSTMQILSPPDSSLGGGFTDCTWRRRQRNPDGTPNSDPQFLPTPEPCSIDIPAFDQQAIPKPYATDEMGFNGEWIDVKIPIPDDYSCTPTDTSGDPIPDSCWVRVVFNYSGAAGDVMDVTTWTAQIDGQPARLIE